MPSVGFTRTEKSGFVITIYARLLRICFYLPIQRESLELLLRYERKVSRSQTKIISWL